MVEFAKNFVDGVVMEDAEAWSPVDVWCCLSVEGWEVREYPREASRDVEGRCVRVAVDVEKVGW
jgi:hypothetical protein